MDIELRVNQILCEFKLYKRGVIEQIASATNLCPRTVSKILQGGHAKPNYDSLGVVCDWMAEAGVTVPLPESIFGRRPSGLINALVAQKTLAFYRAEYQPVEAVPINRSWFARDDVAVVRRLERLCLDQHATAASNGQHRPLSIEHVDMPFHFSSPDATEVQANLEADIDVARWRFDGMRVRADANAVLVGSQRVNHGVELFAADLWSVDPFVSSDGALPIHLLYRDNTHPPSCFGGNRLPSACTTAKHPGLYYRDAAGKWVACPSEPNRSDAGVVIVRRDSTLGRTELVVFGTSSQGTAAMAEILPRHASEFWPAAREERGGLEVLVYVVQIGFGRTKRPDGSFPATAKKIIPMHWLEFGKSKKAKEQAGELVAV